MKSQTAKRKNDDQFNPGADDEDGSNSDDEFGMEETDDDEAIPDGDDDRIGPRTMGNLQKDLQLADREQRNVKLGPPTECYLHIPGLPRLVPVWDYFGREWTQDVVSIMEQEGLTPVR